MQGQLPDLLVGSQVGGLAHLGGVYEYHMLSGESLNLWVGGASALLRIHCKSSS